MTREELIASVMNSSLSAAEMLRRDGEVIAALEAERDKLKAIIGEVRGLCVRSTFDGVCTDWMNGQNAAFSAVIERIDTALKENNDVDR